MRRRSRGAKIGNAHLKWAFSEAAVLFLQLTGRGLTGVKPRGASGAFGRDSFSRYSSRSIRTNSSSATTG
jgi:hypothetical protein